MAEHQHPGVHVEEIDRGPRPIEGVSTNTAALLGGTERGPLTPRLVTSFAEYERWFGDAARDTAFLPDAVRGFFGNGGQRAFICRIAGSGAGTAAFTFGGFTVRAAGPGAWGSRVFARVSDSTTKHADGSSIGFRLQLAYWSETAPGVDPFGDDGRRMTSRPTLTEDFDDLVPDPSSPRFYGHQLQWLDLATEKTAGPERSVLAILARHAGVAQNARPENAGALLAGGTDDRSALGPDDYRGLPSNSRTTEQGLAALERPRYDDVALVYAPAVPPDIAKAIVSHCEQVRFRFAVVDSESGRGNARDLYPREAIGDTAFAAFYYPWLVIADSAAGGRKIVPPGGSVLGIYARSDTQRGVFKAPANEVVRGALGVELDVTASRQDDLNARSVNVIRSFPGRGIRVWGARTMTADALWKYVNVRRFVIFLERSIQEGTQWVVFEPIDERLWARVTDTIRQFLRSQWLRGALLGRAETEAFFVKCDRTTMSQDDILNGRLVCEIGVAPLRPAEFVVFRIFQQAAEGGGQDPPP